MTPLETGWAGAPSSFRKLTWTSTVNRLIQNKQDVPLYEAEADDGCPITKTGAFIEHMERIRELELKAEKHRRTWRKKLMAKINKADSTTAAFKAAGSIPPPKRIAM